MPGFQDATKKQSAREAGIFVGPPAPGPSDEQPAGSGENEQEGDGAAAD